MALGCYSPNARAVDDITALIGDLGERGPVLDATTFGVRCDGKNDVASALNAIIREAVSAARAGKPRSVVALPRAPKTCVLAQPLQITGSVALVAVPGTVVFKPLAGSLGSILVASLSNVTGVLLYGLDVDGGLRDSPQIGSSARDVLVYKSSGVVFDHISIKHTRGIAIEFSTNTYDVVVRNSTFQDIGNEWELSGLRADRAQAINWDCGPPHGRIAVTGNEFRDIGLDPIAVCSAKEVDVSRNRLLISSVQYRYLASPDYPGGIYFVRSSDGVIRDNTIVGAAGACIDVADAVGLVIEGNRGERCGAAGISIAGSSHVLVRSNLLEENAQTVTQGVTKMVQSGGISILGPASDIGIEGNNVQDQQSPPSQRWGVHVLTKRGAVRDVRIDGTNIFAGNASGELTPNLSCVRIGSVRVCSAGATAGSSP